MIEVRGAEQLLALSRALKEAGDKDLQRELSKGLNRAVKPLKAKIRESALTLPKRGGLAAQVAAVKLSTRRPNAKKGLRVIGTGRFSLYHIDQGIIRHGKGHQEQATAPGWWTKPTEALAPTVRAEVEAAMDAVAKKIQNSV